MNKLKCRLCNQGNLSILWRFPGYIYCNRCHTFFSEKIPENMQIIVDREIVSTQIISNRNLELVSSDYRSRIDLLKRYSINIHSLIDIGCGAGLFLETAKNFGIEVYAYEKSYELYKYIKNRGIRVYRYEKSIPTKKFDVATSFDVIEHVINPVMHVRLLKRCIKKTGIVIIETPNSAGLSAKLLKGRWWVFGATAHFTLFSLESLKNLLIREGFEIIYISTNTITPWFMPTDSVFNRLLNKSIYLCMYFVRRMLFKKNLGDNIRVIAKLKYDDVVNIG